MGSPAALKYQVESQKAVVLRQTATDPRLRPMKMEQVQIYYHAALATFVAAWDAYINELVRNFFDVTANPLEPKYDAVHTIARGAADRALEKFNTPNAENTRNLLVQYTGYDPIGDWLWAKKNMSGNAVRLRLNEILKVRHSFAHGFSMPGYSWNQTNTGRIRLTAQAIKDVEIFFRHLVNVTDTGMKKYIENNYNIKLPW